MRCSCTSRSRWAPCCDTRPVRSTSRSGSISRARSSMPRRTSWPTRRTCRCTWARWARAWPPWSLHFGDDAAPGRCLPGEFTVRRRHPSARHDGRLTGLRRAWRPRRVLYGLACASRRRGRDLARLHAAGQPHDRRRRRAGGADAHHARRGARRCTVAPAVLRQSLARAEFPAEPRGPAGAAGGKFPRRTGIAPRRGGPWRLDAARVHAPRAGQRRTLRAPRDPPAARRQLPLRDGQRPGDCRAHRRRAARPARPPSTSRGHHRSRPTTSTRHWPSRQRRCSTSSAR